MAYFIMHRGPNPGEIIELQAAEIRLGRGSKNDIIIHDNEVSREHVRLVRVADGYELYDLNSSNGTFVNGQMVDDVWLLRSQCVVELGDSITLEYNPGDSSHSSGTTDRLSAAGLRPMYLVVNTDSQDEPAVYPLEGKQIRVGRSTTCDIVVIEPEISREHFQLTLTRDGYQIEDLGSTNGTSVNKEPLTEPRPVGQKDVIQIGKTITFQLTETPEVFNNLIRTSLLVDTRELTERPTDLDRPRAATPTPDERLGTRQSPIVGPTTYLQRGQNEQRPPQINLSDQVLLTYAREDWQSVVAPLLQALYHAQVGVWVDQYLTEGSSEWLINTEQARLECWLLLVVVTPNAMRSETVKRNWRHFHNREKPIMLFNVAPVERMPIGAQSLTAVQYNPALPDVAHEQLINEIRRRRGTQ